MSKDTNKYKTYHRWMQSPELREQTASEALTLEEEHQMQSKWPLSPCAVENASNAHHLILRTVYRELADRP